MRYGQSLTISIGHVPRPPPRLPFGGPAGTPRPMTVVRSPQEQEISRTRARCEPGIGAVASAIVCARAALHVLGAGTEAGTETERPATGPRSLRAGCPAGSSAFQVRRGIIVLSFLWKALEEPASGTGGKGFFGAFDLRQNRLMDRRTRRPGGTAFPRGGG